MSGAARAKLPPAAEHDLRRLDQPARHRAQTLDAHPRRCRRWTASAAMRQCRPEAAQDFACHASSFSAAPPKARQLGERLAKRGDLDVTLSLAGRTASPVPHAVPVRVGGFGGVAGLADYLMTQRIDALIDATHPYATIISQNAAAAARDSQRAVHGAAPAAVARGRRRPLDRGERCQRRGARASARHRAASLSRSAATSSRRSSARRSTVIWSAASIRSIRRCRCRR